jgi:ABC-type uncharacterized transport system substrate-binding protein
MAAKTILAVAVGPRASHRIDSGGNLGQVRLYINGLIDGLKPGHPLGSDYVIEYMESDLQNIDSDVAAAVKANNPDLIFAMSTTAVQAAQKATASIDIVFPSVSDPKDDGCDKPPKVTGVSARRSQKMRDCLDDFKRRVPSLAKVYFLYKPGYGPAERALKEVKSEVDGAQINSADEIEKVVGALRENGKVGILVAPVDFLLGGAQRVIAAADKKGFYTHFPVPDLVPPHSSTVSGYGVPQYRCGELAAEHVDKILRGQPPGGVIHVKDSDFRSAP